MDDDEESSWKNIEKELVAPTRPNDFIFSGISAKKCSLYYGPIFTHSLHVFRSLERFLKVKNVWFKASLIWNNTHLLSRGKPFINRAWESKGTCTLNDINGSNSVLSFELLVSRYSVDRHSLFFYFRIRLACGAFKVPWGSELGEHPILKWIQIAPRRIISYIYDKLLSQQYSPTSGKLGLETELKWEMNLIGM